MTEPRPHHMRVKYLMAQMALQDVDRFLDTFGRSGDAEYLPNLWAGIGQQLPADQQLPSDALTTFRSDAEGVVDHVVICMPSPQQQNEAYFLAAIKLPDQTRVFCLEKSTNPSTGQEATVVSEFAKHGRANWGYGCEPDAEQFVEVINTIVANADHQPVSFIPINFA